MDFDASTAEPVAAPAAEPEFDPSTAKPVAHQEPEAPAKHGLEQFRIDPEKFQSMSTWERLKTIVSHPWDKYVESVDAGFKGYDIPRVEADKGDGFINRAGQVGAALDNTAAGIISGVASPGGAVSIASPASAIYTAPRFIAGGIEHLVDAYKGAVSGKDDLQTSAEKVIGGALMAVGGAHGLKTGLKSAVPPSTPAEAVKVLKDEADQTVDPKAKAALNEAAQRVADKANEGLPFDPATAEPVKGSEPFVESTAEALKTPEPEVQVTIQRPQPHPTTGQEIPGYVQIERTTNEGRGEPLTEAERTQFPTQEDVMAKTDLPTGQYSLDEVRAAMAEKASPENITATKNAQVEAEREARNIKAADDAVVRDFPEVKDQAESVLQEDPQAGEKLVSDLKDNPRALTDVENAVLLHRQVQIQNEFRDTPLADVEKINRLSDELLDIYDAGKVAGTETGRGLNARKMAVAEDFSLANLVTLRRAAKGSRLTPEELTETQKLHDRISQLQDEFDTYKRPASELLQSDESLAAPQAKRSRLVDSLKTRADAARERIAARWEKKFTLGAVEGPEGKGLLSTENLADFADIGAYHLARGVVKAADWSAEMVKEFGDKITPHLQAIREKAEQLLGEETTEKAENARLEAYKKRTFKRALEIENKAAIGDFAKKERKPLELDEEGRRIQAKLESAKAEFASALERDRYEKLSAIGKLKEQGLNTYDAARNLMTTGEFSFILRQGKMTALSHPILTAKALPATVKALFSDEVGARAIDLQTMNQPEAATARAAKLHLVDEGAKLSRQEEIFASKWAEKIPGLRNFNQAGRVFLNKVRFDVWKTLREQLPEITPERDAQLAKFVNEATGRGTLGGAEAAAVPLGRVLFSPRFLASRIQLLVGHSLWGGDFATRRIIAKEYAKTLVALGIYYTLLAQMKDKHGNPATIEKDPRSSDFGKVKIGNTRLDPLAGLAQLITFSARTATLERKDAKNRIQSLQNPPFGGQKWSDVAANFGRSKLHPVPGAIINLFNGTDLGGNPATIQNQALNLSFPLTYMDVYQALQEQDMPEAAILSLLTLLGEGLQTYDANKKKPKPVPPNKN